MKKLFLIVIMAIMVLVLPAMGAPPPATTKHFNFTNSPPGAQGAATDLVSGASSAALPLTVTNSFTTTPAGTAMLVVPTIESYFFSQEERGCAAATYGLLTPTPTARSGVMSALLSASKTGGLQASNGHLKPLEPTSRSGVMPSADTFQIYSNTWPGQARMT